jgi:hypothetical protein
MKQIRPNMWQVTYSELGKPDEKGYYKIPEGKGSVILDEADIRYIGEYLKKGFEPTFFIKPSAALRGAFTVVSRQRV